MKNNNKLPATPTAVKSKATASEILRIQDPVVLCMTPILVIMQIVVIAMTLIPVFPSECAMAIYPVAICLGAGLTIPAFLTGICTKDALLGKRPHRTAVSVAFLSSTILLGSLFLCFGYIRTFGIPQNMGLGDNPTIALVLMCLSLFGASCACFCMGCLPNKQDVLPDSSAGKASDHE